MSAVFIVLLFFLPHASELVMSARTWNNIAAALTRFYEWAAMTGEIAKSPVAYRAFTDLLISTGMRINEANSLLLGDLPAPYAPECPEKRRFLCAFTEGQRAGKFGSFVFLCTCFGQCSGISLKIVMMPLPCFPPVTVPRNYGCLSPADR